MVCIFCIFVFICILYSCTSEMRVGSHVSHFSLGRLSVFTPSSFSSWTWCKRRDLTKAYLFDIRPIFFLDQYLRAQNINFIFIKTNDHQSSGLTQASTTSSKYVWSDSDVNFKTGGSVWWMENPFSGTCPASRSTFRLTVVDRPTQLFYIWIFICWVGGGEPCGHEELSLSGSSIG